MKADSGKQGSCESFKSMTTVKQWIFLNYVTCETPCRILYYCQNVTEFLRGRVFLTELGL